ncbi:hypothetical protein BDV98DRAFT_563206 [Pterulicium gracile]|uniref:Putative gamma-glutamylcyclotransferase n=1 Tax=Pterulicium gracile TaxID=1884261 RepID=A0A5C3QPG5_9AGAR|nr:hypothetical protein BDV98DRAFT_563206 [Pterula gracilis]
MSTHSAFFYGTLMHPNILRRVIGNDGSHLHICPAVLLHYTRHQVKHADYPGIVPYTESKIALLDGKDLPLNDESVRGAFVSGLTTSDIRCLDVFEGSEYARIPVHVHPLGPINPLSTTSNLKEKFVPPHPTPLPPVEELADPVEVETYVYKDIEGLRHELWSFDEFVKNNAWKWIGNREAEYGVDNEYAEVDRRRDKGTVAST